MGAYTGSQNRSARTMRVDAASMDFINEFASRYNITFTAALHIIVENGIAVQRTIDARLPDTLELVAATRR